MVRVSLHCPRVPTLLITTGRHSLLLQKKEVPYESTTHSRLKAQPTLKGPLSRDHRQVLGTLVRRAPGASLCPLRSRSRAKKSGVDALFSFSGFFALIQMRGEREKNKPK